MPEKLYECSACGNQVKAAFKPIRCARCHCESHALSLMIDGELARDLVKRFMERERGLIAFPGQETQYDPKLRRRLYNRFYRQGERTGDWSKFEEFRKRAS